MPACGSITNGIFCNRGDYWQIHFSPLGWPNWLVLGGPWRGSMTQLFLLPMDLICDAYGL